MRLCGLCREKRLAKKYYDKLYKEYCLADLSLYKSNKVCIVFLNVLSTICLTYLYIVYYSVFFLVCLFCCSEIRSVGVNIMPT